MQSIKHCVGLLHQAEARALANRLLGCHPGAGLLPCLQSQDQKAAPSSALSGSALLSNWGNVAGFHTTTGALAEDYYTILGLSKGASDQEIKRSFYKLAKQYHPDTNKDNPAAAKRFQEVNRAYQTLRDPEKRSMYDRVGREAMERMEAEGGASSSGGGAGPFGDGSAGFTAQDIFEMFARAGGGGGGGGRGGFGGFNFMSSFMMEEVVRISLEEAVSGVQRQVKVQVNPYGPPLTVPITIPPGVDSGMGLQEQVALGQVNMLLTVRIEVLPHRTFKRNGDDLHVHVDVSLVDALLGGHVDVPTLAGARPIQVPSCSLNEDVLILPGYGMPRLTKPGRGNLKVHLRVKKPKGGLTERQRHLLVEFEREESNKARARSSSSGSSSSSSSTSHTREAPFQGAASSSQQQGKTGASGSTGTKSSSGSSSQTSEQQQERSTSTSSSSGTGPTTSSSSTSNSTGGTAGSSNSDAGGSWFDAAKNWFKPGGGHGAGGPSSSSSSADKPEGEKKARKSGG